MVTLRGYFWEAISISILNESSEVKKIVEKVILLNSCKNKIEELGQKALDNQPELTDLLQSIRICLLRACADAALEAVTAKITTYLNKYPEEKINSPKDNNKSQKFFKPQSGIAEKLALNQFKTFLTSMQTQLEKLLSSASQPQLSN